MVNSCNVRRCTWKKTTPNRTEVRRNGTCAHLYDRQVTDRPVCLKCQCCCTWDCTWLACRCVRSWTGFSVSAAVVAHWRCRTVQARIDQPSRVAGWSGVAGPGRALARPPVWRPVCRCSLSASRRPCRVVITVTSTSWPAGRVTPHTSVSIIYIFCSQR